MEVALVAPAVRMVVLDLYLNVEDESIIDGDFPDNPDEPGVIEWIYSIYPVFAVRCLSRGSELATEFLYIADDSDCFPECLSMNSMAEEFVAKRVVSCTWPSERDEMMFRPVFDQMKRSIWFCEQVRRSLSSPPTPPPPTCAN